jgi:hypothetical protein
MKKLDGVTACEVSWGRRVAEVQFAPRSTASVAELRRLIRFAHLMPKEAKLTVEGTLQEEKGERSLLLESGESFRLQADKLPGAPGDRLEVRGTLAADPARGNPAGEKLVLEVEGAKAVK